MAVLLKKVVLNLPHVIESQSVGQFDLVESIFEQTMFVSFTPRTGDLMLVEQAKLHYRNLMGR